MAFKIVSQTVTEVEDRDPNLYVRRAEDSLKQRQYTQALNEMEKAISYAPHNKKNSYIFEKIKIYEAIGRDSTSVDFIKKHINALYYYLSLADFYRVVAVLQKNTNDTGRILKTHHIPSVLSETYRSAANTSRNYFVNSAESYRRKGQFALALECLSVIDDKYGENVDSCLLKAQIIQSQGKLRDALSYYKRAANLSGATVDVYLDTVKLLLQLRQSGEAKRWIETGLKKFNHHSELLHFKADLLFKEGNYEDCIATCDTILANNHSDAKAIYLKGLAYDQKGNYFSSNWLLKKAKRLNSNLVLPQNNARERMIFRTKFLVISLAVLLVLLVGGQYILFKTGVAKPWIQSSNVGIPEGKIFVGQTLEIDSEVLYFPFYAEEPEARVVVSHPELVKIESSGNLIGLKEGKTSLKLVWGNRVLASQTIQINEPKVMELVAKLSETQLAVGDSTKLSTSIKMDYDQAKVPDITFTSSNPSVALVDKAGGIRAFGIGKATITASAGGVSETNDVLVVPKVNEIVLDENPISLQIGEKHTLKASVVTTPPGQPITLDYSTDDFQVATVNSSGEIEAVGFGETYITVSTLSGVKNRVLVSIKPKKVSNLRAEFSESTMSIRVEWDYDAPTDQEVSFDFDVSKDGVAKDFQSLEKKIEDIYNVSFGSNYKIWVTAVIEGVKSETETVEVNVTKAVKPPASSSTSPTDGSGNAEADALKSKRISTMNGLIGYWKRTDEVATNSSHDDRYIFILVVNPTGEWIFRPPMAVLAVNMIRI
ncbi:Ig-like domain-containing protein [Neobacillus niacini]|uniref:Ig-like domain-containing protein n=1 Tax=Neobacillus niacini TaxID=86668 RepID=UPI002FFDCE85